MTRHSRSEEHTDLYSVTERHVGKEAWDLSKETITVGSSCSVAVILGRRDICRGAQGAGHVWFDLWLGNGGNGTD